MKFNNCQPIQKVHSKRFKFFIWYRKTSRKRSSGTRNSPLINYSRPRARKQVRLGVHWWQETCTICIHPRSMEDSQTEPRYLMRLLMELNKRIYEGGWWGLSSVVINWLFKHVQGILDIPGATVFIDGRRADFSCKSEIEIFTINLSIETINLQNLILKN